MTLPIFSGSKKEIILLLSETWPLSVKEIFSSVSRNGFSGSYQAVHKALKELENDGIVVHRNKKYLLSDDWIHSLNDFAFNLKDKYANNLSKSLDNQNFSFNTIHDCDVFLLNSMHKILSNNKSEKKPLLALQWSHAWIPLFISRKEYSEIAEAFKLVDCYSLVKGNSSIDTWCADFWRKQGMKVKLNCDIASPVEMIAVGDYVLQVFYSQKIKNDMNKFYSKVKSVKALDLNELFEKVFEKKTEINVTINKNPSLAEQLKKETMSYFK